MGLYDGIININKNVIHPSEISDRSIIMLKNQEQLIMAADLIAAQFGPDTEVVIHDFTGDLEHTIVYIVNGHVTGREVGGSPTKLFIKYVSFETHEKYKFRYITNMPDGRVIRSSTVNFFDDEGQITGAMCINQDITNLAMLQKAFGSMAEARYFENWNASAVVPVAANSASDNDSELNPASIQGLLEGIIAEGLNTIGMPPDKMNKDAKIRFITFLDKRGVFLIQKSGQRVCDLLGISKFTLYNYLDEIRGKQK